MTEKSDRELVAAALSGDVDSFTELCSRYYGAMVAIAHAILGDKHLAEDAAQEAFAKASRNLPKLKKLDRFAGWLTVICRNVAKDMARTATARPHYITNIDEDLSALTDETDTDGQIEAVRDAISKLQPAAKELIFLRYYDSMTYQQISAVLGISEQVINGRLRRAKKAIADYLRREASVEVRL